jgi:N utilization substance protein B
VSDHTRTSSRRESRERAIELGYEAEQRGWTVDELLASLALPIDSFAEGLLRGAEDNREQLDALIDEASDSWPLSRMALLDVVIMRQAGAELMAGQTPRAVVLSQAVELATRYSTDGSGRFINGILSTVADRVQIEN